MGNIASKLIWKALFVISGGLTCWFLLTCALQWWNFFTLSEEVSAQVIHWEIKRINDSKFFLKAHYRYDKDNQIFEGKTVLDRVTYFNRPSAQEAIEQNKLKKWKAWVNPRSPKNSSLQRDFSVKNIFRGIVCLGVFFYFLYLYSSRTSEEELSV